MTDRPEMGGDEQAARDVAVPIANIIAGAARRTRPLPRVRLLSDDRGMGTTPSAAGDCAAPAGVVVLAATEIPAGAAASAETDSADPREAAVAAVGRPCDAKAGRAAQPPARGRPAARSRTVSAPAKKRPARQASAAATIADPASTADKPQAERRGARWTKGDRATFLERLAMTCSVGSAAAVVKRTAKAAHELRRRDEEFATDWASALQEGYARLEAALLEHAIAGCVPAGDAAPDASGTVAVAPASTAPVRDSRGRFLPGSRAATAKGKGAAKLGTTFDAALVLKILQQNAGRIARAVPVTRMPIAEIEDLVMRRLDAIEKRLAQ